MKHGRIDSIIALYAKDVPYDTEQTIIINMDHRPKSKQNYKYGSYVNEKDIDLNQNKISYNDYLNNI